MASETNIYALLAVNSFVTSFVTILTQRLWDRVIEPKLIHVHKKIIKPKKRRGVRK